MKIKFLLLCTLAYTSLFFSQSKLELEAQEFFWGENDTYKNAVDIPEKWQNESAVVIYKNENYDFHKFGKRVEYKSSLRKRIKLLDQASVTEFSTFTYQKRFNSSKGVYQYNASYAIIGLKIIKQDGKETIIDMEKEAVEVDGETKIAIANLEIGDILDFFYYSIEPFKSVYAFGFEPVEQTLGEEYPIMDYKLYFETENDFFINFNSYNGAPELTEIPVEKNNTRRYELVAADIEKHKFERWFYPLVELPCYKFQVYFARSGKFEDDALAFLPEEEEIIKKTVSPEEVLEANERYVFPRGDLKYEERFIKDHEFSSDVEKITDVFYYMRHFYLTRFVEAIVIDQAGIIEYPYGVYNDDARSFNTDIYFIRHFIAVLKESKIKYDILLSKKRYDGSLDDLLIRKNLNMVIRTHTQPQLYINLFGPHTTINTFDPLTEGTTAYAMTPVKRWDIDHIEPTEIPVSTFDDNKTEKNFTVTLSEDFSSLEITSEVHYFGHEKKDQQFDRVIFSDYVHEDYEKFQTESFLDLVRKSKREKIGNQLEAVIEKLQENQKKDFIAIAKNEYSIPEISDYTYSIKALGRYAFEDPFTFTETFTAKDALIKKAGPNYIVEVGKLIGGQIDILDEERKRVENIHMNYPRSYNYAITLNIPDGYSVSGLAKLNKNVANKTGAFISTATLEGNQLLITSSKQYKNNYEDNADWPLMMAFLDEAFQFTNEKILLKKN